MTLARPTREDEIEATIESKPHLERTTHTPQEAKTSRRPLEPVDRISEVWFGLVMVLTFTCSLSVTKAGQEEVRTMLIGAIGCNLAWGLIDGFMYVLGCFIERGRGISALRALRVAKNPTEAQRIIAAAMPPLLASVISESEFEALRQRMNLMTDIPGHPRLSREDWLGGLGVLLAVFLSTFPVVIPFLLTSDARLALRISNGVAIVMLFTTGYAFGRYAGYRPWRMGCGMAIVGSVLVAIAIVLGG